MAPTLRPDDDLLEGLRVVRERDGIPPSEHGRRDPSDGLEANGVMRLARGRTTARNRRS